jgi:hypothetical protein
LRSSWFLRIESTIDRARGKIARSGLLESIWVGQPAPTSFSPVSLTHSAMSSARRCGH